MPKTNNSPTPDIQIRMENLSMEESLSIDKMRLTVTNICPLAKQSWKRYDRFVDMRLTF